MAELIWEGASLLSPTDKIRLYLTGRDKASANRKTGAVLQTYILLANEKPTDAVTSGADFAICGNCVHRGSPRSCYVNVGQAPNAIHRAKNVVTELAPELCAGHVVRLGAYGDPAAIPFGLWDRLLVNAIDWLGYTHQWRTCDQRLRRFCMASVDSDEDFNDALDLGWRCFYVGKSIAYKPQSAVLCPASAEAGKKLTCEQCRHCSGLGGARRTGNVFIPVHGPSWAVQRFKEKVA